MGGLELLVKEGVVEIMVSLAETCQVLSIRGYVPENSQSDMYQSNWSGTYIQ